MRRKLTGNWRWISSGVAIAFTLFQIYTTAFGYLPAMQQRSIHVLFGFALTLLMVGPRKKKLPDSSVPWWDLVLIGLVIASTITSSLRWEWWVFHLAQSSTLDLFMGSVLVILVLETGRRMTGWVFPTLTALVLAYAFLGPYIPGIFGHRGFAFDFIMQELYQGTQGVYGFITGISATMIAMMFIFVAVLLFTGGGQTFIDISLLVAGRFRGGPALVAVLASSMFAMVSGGPSTNVAATGSFTIPMMKKLGYESHFAGGVEAAASTGGQITPPIMGAGAFVMAELLGVSYLTVVIAAIIPAFLYYTAIFSGVRFQSLRMNLPPVPLEEMPRAREVLNWRRLGPLVLPLAALLGFLGKGFTPGTAALWATVVAVIIFLVTDVKQVKLRLKALVSALERAGMTLIQLVPLLVCANIVIKLLALTGVGVKLSGFITSITGDSLLVSLIVAGGVALVMGMGLPTVASYLIAFAIVGPIILGLGVLPMATHLFIFYYAILSNITPPVCLAVYVASGIAEASWFKISKVALRLAMVAYFIPFVFVYDNALILTSGAGTGKIIVAVIPAILGAIFLGAGTSGFFVSRMSLFSRAIMVAGAFLLLLPGWNTGWIGLAAVAIATFGDKMAQSYLERRKSGIPSIKPPGTYIEED